MVELEGIVGAVAGEFAGTCALKAVLLASTKVYVLPAALYPVSVIFPAFAAVRVRVSAEPAIAVVVASVTKNFVATTSEVVELASAVLRLP